MAMFDLTGRKAIVTGGNRGLGRAVTEAYHEQGAEVVIIARENHGETAAREIMAQGGPGVYGVSADLADRQQLRRGFNESLEKLGGRLDIIFNNAGINRNHLCIDFPEDDWDIVQKINMDAAFLLSQLAGKVMIGQKYGRIINMASLLSVIGGRLSLAYAAAKGGVVQMTKAMSNEWAKSGVTVNCIAPGYMNTDMNRAYFSDLSKSGHLLGRIPVGRWGEEGDLKSAAVFLAAEESGFVTGIMLPVDGGFLAW